MAGNSPPYFEQYMSDQTRHYYWVGTRDGYAPQLCVDKGPSLEELEDRYRDAATTILYLTARTNDMDVDEPDDVIGGVEVKITNIHRDNNNSWVHFMAHSVRNIHASWLSDTDMWVWEYDGEHSAGADFSADN